MLKAQAAFMASCKLMELDVIGNTTITDSIIKFRNITGPDETVYTGRRLSVTIEFLGGLFMKIDQKPEYTGQFKQHQMEPLQLEKNTKILVNYLLLHKTINYISQ
jgi:hypothetical protein